MRSLVPKLTGRTRIGSSDGRALARYLLSNWPEAAPENGEVHYKALLSPDEIDALVGVVEIQLGLPSSAPIANPSYEDGETGDKLPGTPNADLIGRLYRDCDAERVLKSAKRFSDKTRDKTKA